MIGWSKGQAATITVDDNSTYQSTSAVGGSSSDATEVSGNTVNMVTNGVVGNPGDLSNGGRSIHGGETTGSGAVHNNTVVITGGHVFLSSPLPNNYMGGRGIGGYATVASEAYVHHNRVLVSGGQIDDEVMGGYSYGNVENNTVEISGSASIGIGSDPFTGDVTGGYSRYGVANDNTVTIDGGTVRGDVTGGFVQNDRPNTEATRNTVIIRGGTIGGVVVGGSAERGNAYGNLVEVTGGTVSDIIAGGFSEFGDAVNNTVRIGENAILSATDTEIYGGYTNLGADQVTGNTLYLDGYRGAVKSIGNFAAYHFHLPASLINGDTLVAITGGINTDLTGATIGGISIDAASTLDTAHSVTLIDKATGAFAPATVQAAKGATLLYDVSVEIDGGNRLVATLGGSSRAHVNPQGKALAQSRVGGMTILGQGADLVANNIFTSAMSGVPLTGAAGGPAVFGTTSYASYRVKTGSHVDSDGWSLAAGLAWKNNGPDCAGWVAGVFFETGRGSYDGYNSFSTAPTVHSSGDITYYGGGVMGQYRFQNGLRAEGSFRLGRLETDYSAGGFVGGARPDYELNSTYFGGHVGLGYERQLTGCLSLDLSAKYLWTRQSGKTVAILGERTRFDAVDSQRTRVGGQLAYTRRLLSPYAGAYFEYEFDGKANTRNESTSIRYSSPTVKGATYAGELGVKITPVERLVIDVSVQGHAGRRDGFQGRLAAGWSF
ncbi:MAG: autotransporter outer membrane beta-barrel domain-containing protein [Planctomycetaceae bacterium]|nr:autotransporter outer membrane beta-barrel domain-containing protein [Planctomycetaceae bacterium]